MRLVLEQQLPGDLEAAARDTFRLQLEVKLKGGGHKAARPDAGPGPHLTTPPKPSISNHITGTWPGTGRLLRLSVTSLWASAFKGLRKPLCFGLCDPKMEGGGQQTLYQDVQHEGILILHNELSPLTF